MNYVGSSAAASVTLVGATRGAAAGSVLVGQTVKPVTVHVLDDDGAIATGYNGAVSIGCVCDDSLFPASGGFTDADVMLDGTRTVQAVAGVAVLSDLSLRVLGNWRFVPRAGA